jgi:hypothetical protein
VAIANEMPAMLAGGLRPANVAQALRDVPAIGADVASGVELGGTKPPRKDALAVALFTKRARAARFDLPQTASRPQPVAVGLLEADAHGRWGTQRDLGGRFVPETLMAALLELEHTYNEIRRDPNPAVLNLLNRFRNEAGIEASRLEEKYTVEEIRGFVEDSGLVDEAIIFAPASGYSSLGCEVRIGAPR